MDDFTGLEQIVRETERKELEQRRRELANKSCAEIRRRRREVCLLDGSD